MTTVVLVNAETGDEDVRPMTAAEQTQRKKDEDAEAARAAEPTPPTLADRLAAVEARLDKAASVTVTGDAAKLRDNLR